jgi:hypothetical protein
VFSISYHTGFIFYLLFMLAAFALAVIQDMLRRRSQDWSMPEEKLTHCSDCNCTFIAVRGARLAHCPRCRKQCKVSQR